MSLTHNVKLTVTDTPGGTVETQLFPKTLHFEYDVVVPQLLSDHIADIAKEVADAMAFAATTVLYELATKVQDVMTKNMAQQDTDPSLN